ncbi:ankycorbin-like [Punica granatum]|uniref:Ankycorbin-like n=1 Tax=Punica granatum TaxID=22663 RepID=A0A6P8BXT3_PUNGR|nr:ankycorbin-like [Punica granatum]
MTGDDHEFMNSKDDDGSTILHLAAADQQFERYAAADQRLTLDVVCLLMVVIWVAISSITLFLEDATAYCCHTPHREFVKEILRGKPEMAKELDFWKSSLLHLATAKGHVEVVKLLLLGNTEVCLFRDMDGRNPCHVAVIKGHSQVLKELVQAKPEAARAEI